MTFSPHEPALANLGDHESADMIIVITKQSETISFTYIMEYTAQLSQDIWPSLSPCTVTNPVLLTYLLSQDMDTVLWLVLLWLYGRFPAS